MRELSAAIVLWALAAIVILGVTVPARAADLPGHGHSDAYACAPREEVVLFTEQGHFPTFHIPTEPARTPYYTCVTGRTLKPGDIPPPPEYCCG